MSNERFTSFHIKADVDIDGAVVAMRSRTEYNCDTVATQAKELSKKLPDSDVCVYGGDGSLGGDVCMFKYKDGKKA